MTDQAMPARADAVVEEGMSAPEARPPALAGHIDIISDAICPWCWIGKRHFTEAVAQLAAEGLHFTQHWRPYQLNPEMPAAGMARAAYRARKFGNVDRARALDAQVADVGRAAGLDFQFERIARTPNTVAAHRLIRLAGLAGRQDAVVEALFAAYFNAGRDIGDLAVLRAVGEEAGLDAATLDALTEAEVGREEVLAEDAALRAAGLSGVPSFVLDRHLLFSGALPAADMAAQISRAVRILRERAAG